MNKLIIFLAFCTSLIAKPAIVFDFGGVLATVDKNEVLSFIQESLVLSPMQVQELVKEVRKQRGKSKDETEAWMRGAKMKKIALPPHFTEDLERKSLGAIQKKPHMMELIETLKEKGHRVAMLSNISKREAALIRRRGFYAPFDPVLLSCEIGVSKPHKRAFSLLIEKLALPAQEILFIDDQIQNVEAAKKCGIDAIHFTSFEQLQDALKERQVLTK